MNESSQHDNQDAWQPCPQGTLDQAVVQINARQRQEVMKRTMRVGGGLCAMLLVVVVGSFYLKNAPPSYGGITCGECASHMQAYHDNALVDMSLVKSVKTHLEHCEYCQEHYQQEFGPAPADGEIALVVSSPNNHPARSGLPMLVLAGTAQIK